jgi:PTH1 family peptidyl-tRNA hydrolase
MIDHVITGLGNPGKEHAQDRHNVGFWCSQLLARRHGIKLHKSGLVNSGEGVIGGANVLLLEPLNFINRSGGIIAPILRKQGIPTSSLIVIYDDLDLPQGRVRLRPEGGNGGHNGVRSIIDATGASDFGRIRIGIGRPRDRGVPTWDPDKVRDYVLAEPRGEDREILDEAVAVACDAVESIISDGWERAMNKYNTRP